MCTLAPDHASPYVSNSVTFISLCAHGVGVGAGVGEGVGGTGVGGVGYGVGGTGVGPGVGIDCEHVEYGNSAPKFSST